MTVGLHLETSADYYITTIKGHPSSHFSTLKGRFWITNSRFEMITAHGICQSTNLTSWTAPGRRVGIRSKLIQLRFKVAPNVWLQKNEMDKWDS